MVPAQADSGGAFELPLSPQAAAALAGLLATDAAAGALCGALQGGAPAFGPPLADALCSLAERLQARPRAAHVLPGSEDVRVVFTRISAPVRQRAVQPGRAPAGNASPAQD